LADQKEEELANTLKKSGLAASMHDALEKAKSILGISKRKLEEQKDAEAPEPGKSAMKEELKADLAEIEEPAHEQRTLTDEQADVEQEQLGEPAPAVEPEPQADMTADSELAPELEQPKLPAEDVDFTKEEKPLNELYEKNDVTTGQAESDFEEQAAESETEKPLEEQTVEQQFEEEPAQEAPSDKIAEPEPEMPAIEEPKQPEAPASEEEPKQEDSEFMIRTEDELAHQEEEKPGDESFITDTDSLQSEDVITKEQEPAADVETDAEPTVETQQELEPEPAEQPVEEPAEPQPQATLPEETPSEQEPTEEQPLEQPAEPEPAAEQKPEQQQEEAKEEEKPTLSEKEKKMTDLSKIFKYEKKEE